MRTPPDKKVQPPEKTIEAVLEAFLGEQRSRLKPKTMGRYEYVIDLFQDCMDGYAYQSLDTAESALFDRFNSARGDEQRGVCQVFGPEKIAENVGEFLNYFMIRKVICGKDMMRAAGTVTKKLGKWLLQKGYVGEEQAEDVVEHGADAARDLTDMLMEYADRTAPDHTEKVLEDHFTIEAVKPKKLHLRSLSGAELIVIPVDRDISDACRVGWTIAGEVGKTSGGWRIMEAWNVYP